VRNRVTGCHRVAGAAIGRHRVAGQQGVMNHSITIQALLQGRRASSCRRCCNRASSCRRLKSLFQASPLGFEGLRPGSASGMMQGRRASSCRRAAGRHRVAGAATGRHRVAGQQGVMNHTEPPHRASHGGSGRLSGGRASEAGPRASEGGCVHTHMHAHARTHAHTRTQLFY
jgi:hypothetical protein